MPADEKPWTPLDDPVMTVLKKRKLPLYKKLLFTAVMVAACLAVLEISLRLSWTRPTQTIAADRQIMQRDETLGWRPKPNQNYKTHYAGAPHEITLRTNSRGFRDGEHAMETGPGVIRIVVLGDSFAFGSGVSNGEIFTDRLQELVPHTEVINLGVTGFRTIQYRRALQEEGLRYRPRLVILGFCQNDVTEQCIPEGNPDAVAEPRHDWRDQLNKYSYLADFAGGRVARCKPLSKWLANIGVKRPLGDFESLSDNLRTALVEYPPQLSAMWNSTLQELEEIKNTCDASSARLLVAAIPAREAVDSDALAATLAAVKYGPEEFDLAKPYRQLDEFCRNRHIAYVAAYQAARDAKMPLYLPNDVHFNSAGHQLLAEVLAVKVKELLSAE